MPGLPSGWNCHSLIAQMSRYRLFALAKSMRRSFFDRVYSSRHKTIVQFHNRTRNNHTRTPLSPWSSHAGILRFFVDGNRWHRKPRDLDGCRNGCFCLLID